MNSTSSDERPDIETVREFFNSWRIYQHFKALNYVSHREVYSVLHRFLLENLPEAFTMIDFGCGDVESIAVALNETGIVEYTGIDMCHPALEMARGNLAELNCRQLLIEGDYSELIALHREALRAASMSHVMRDAASSAEKKPADLGWAALTLHHLSNDAKQEFCHGCRELVKPSGYLMIYDPMLAEGETREDFLKRWEDILKTRFTGLSREDSKAMLEHVSRSDYPESLSTMREMGKKAGFGRMKVLFEDPTGVYQLIVLSGGKSVGAVETK